MVRWQILLMAFASLVAAVLFARVARQVLPPTHRRVNVAQVALVVAWIAFSIQAATDAARLALGAFGEAHLFLYSTLARLKIAAAAAAIWGFGVYVVGLHDRSTRIASRVLIPFSVVHALIFLVAMEWRAPRAVRIDTWATRLEFANDATLPGSLGPATFLFFFAPPIVIAAFYLWLVRRPITPPVRVRVAATSLAIMILHAVALFQFNPDLPADSLAFPLFGIATVATAVACYVAHRPSAPLDLASGLDAALPAEPPTSPRTNPLK